MKKLIILLAGLLISAGSGTHAQTKELISLEEFSTKLKTSAGAQLLDVRSTEEFRQNHIKGALNADIRSSGYQALIDGLSKDKPTFVYSIANGRSAVLSAELRQKGFKEVYELPGGLANWIGSGYPVISKTKKGISLSLAQYQALTGSSDLVLIDFGSKYCGACKKLIPVLDSLKTNTAFNVKVISIEQYDNTDLAKQLRINVLPTLVLYHGKKEVWKKQGFSSTRQIEEVLNEYKTQPVHAVR